jgi:ribosomal protein L21E
MRLYPFGPDPLMGFVGTQRYGQCTRYLAGLKIGQKVTVSIKPSVMKVRSFTSEVVRVVDIECIL